MESKFHATILTLFPEMFPGILDHALAGRALRNGLWSYDTVNIRDYATNKHKNVDDTPAGGGAGMILRPDVVGNAIDDVLSKKNYPTKIYFSPRGIKVTQGFIKDIVNKKNALFLCGRYEGLDQRVIDEYNLLEVSLGDFILSGGEACTLTVLDACIRMVDGVVGNRESLTNDSFENDLLEYPLYTKPYSWKGREIPDILQSGHHKRINEWRLEKSLDITKQRRPDLWAEYKNKI